MLQFLDIGAGTKGPFAAPGHDQCAGAGLCNLIYCPPNIFKQRERQRIERLWPRDRKESKFLWVSEFNHDADFAL